MSVKVFDLLTATPAPVSGKPEPTRTFQWLRNGTAISGANAQTYFLQPADEGALVSVRQIETNLIGKATATSATVGPIEAVDIVEATGGIETVIEQNGKFYRVHTFLESGDLTVTSGGEVEYLVVAGGGGGGGSGGRGGGGGGGGGLKKWVPTDTGGNSDLGPLALTAGTHVVHVGEGGAGSGSSSIGNPGGPSSIAGVVSEGGGGGAGSLSDDPDVRDGGSGGAGNQRLTNFEGGSGIPGQGHDGGNGSVGGDGAGGGGAGGPGGDAEGSTRGGDGGLGLVSGISGSDVIYAAGGRGTSNESNGAIPPGSSNSGSGGNSQRNSSGAGGRPGIVIIRYPITEAEYNAEAA